jgi:antitoxin FitA
MPTLTIRNVEEATIARLKERAKAHNRSLEAEVREVLNGIQPAVDKRELKDRMRALSEAIRAYNEGRTLRDTAELIANDRDRCACEAACGAFRYE